MGVVTAIEVSHALALPTVRGLHLPNLLHTTTAPARLCRDLDISPKEEGLAYGNRSQLTD